MNENIIAWNVTNWVTVILMAAVGFFLVGSILKWRQSKRNPPIVSVNTTTSGVQGIA